MRGERGFTLIEVVVALAIAGLGLAALFAASSAGLASVDQSARYTAALRHAQARLAEFGITEPVRPGVQRGRNSDGSLWRIVARPLATRPGATRGRSGHTLYAVEVTVTWTWAGRTRFLRLDTYRAGPAATAAE